MLGYYATQVSDGRDQQHVLPPAEGERAARVGVAGARARSRSRSRRASASRITRGSSQSRRDAVEFLLKNTASLGDELGPMLFQLPPNLKKDLDRAASVSRPAAARTGDSRSSSGTRAGSTTTCSTRCAIATSRCASPSRPTSSRPVVSHGVVGLCCGCTGSTTTTPALGEWAKCVNGAGVEGGVRLLQARRRGGLGTAGRRFVRNCLRITGHPDGMFNADEADLTDYSDCSLLVADR